MAQLRSMLSHVYTVTAKLAYTGHDNYIKKAGIMVTLHSWELASANCGYSTSIRKQHNISNH